MMCERDEEIVSQYRSQLSELTIKIARNNIAGKHSVAQELMNEILEIGHAMVEELDGKRKDNVIRLITKDKFARPIGTVKKAIGDGNAGKPLTYELVAELLNSIRAYRLSAGIEVPQVSEENLNNMFERILLTDRELEILQSDPDVADVDI